MREHADAAVTPMLTRGELLRRSGPVWATEHQGRAPLLFQARDPHVLVLTDQRLVLLTGPRRRRPLTAANVLIAKRYSAFSLVRMQRFRPMLQLRIRTPADRILVLEFRPRDRSLGRELAHALGPPETDDGNRAEEHGPDPGDDEQDIAALRRR